MKELTGAPGVELRCSVDQPFFAGVCPDDGSGAKLTWKDLAPGKHTFFVTATDDDANRTMIGVTVTTADGVTRKLTARR